eukprot:6060686-Alexandrium_andersonii.AAC.1
MPNLAPAGLNQLTHRGSMAAGGSAPRPAGGPSGAGGLDATARSRKVGSPSPGLRGASHSAGP